MSETLPQPVSSNYQYEIAEQRLQRDGAKLQVPELNISKNASKYPRRVFNFFQDLWELNGYSSIKFQHHDVLVLPAVTDRPLMYLINRYRGLSDGEVVDRKKWLEHYNEQRLRLYKLKDPAVHKMQEAKLARILKHVPDVGGLQGVQQYSLYIPRSDRSRLLYRFSGAGAVQASEIYCLEPEATMYGVPNRPSPQNTSPYKYTPYLSGHSLQFDGELFQPAAYEERGAAYGAHWQQLLEQIVPLLADRPLGS